MCDAFEALGLPGWFDGIEAIAIEPRGDSTVFWRGLAWVTLNGQWRIPVEVKFRCTLNDKPCLNRIDVRLGDRETGLVPFSWGDPWPEQWITEMQIEDL